MATSDLERDDIVRDAKIDVLGKVPEGPKPGRIGPAEAPGGDEPTSTGDADNQRVSAESRRDVAADLPKS